MGILKQLKDAIGNKIYPITSGKAVILSNGKNVEETMASINFEATNADTLDGLHASDLVTKSDWFTDGTNRVISDALLVDYDTASEYFYKRWGVIHTSTTNLPDDILVGIREPLEKFDDNSVLVTVTELYPDHSRVWKNMWSKEQNTWLGWKCDRDGGNASTVGGWTATTLMKDLGYYDNSDLNIDEFNDYSFRGYLGTKVLGTFPVTPSFWYFEHYKSNVGNHRYQRATSPYSGKYYDRLMVNGVWNDWVDRTNADTVDGKHASDFALVNHGHSGLAQVDSRSDNNTPEWYMKNKNKGICVEFKTGTAIGLTTAGHFQLITHIPWSDLSGGRPVQYAIATVGTWKRVSTSDTEWGTWVKQSDNEVPIVASTDYNNFANGTVFATTGCANSPTDYCIVTTNKSLNGDGYQKAYSVLYRISFIRYVTEASGWTAWADSRDGGNAYTVDGSHAWEMQTLNSEGSPHGSGSWPLKCQFNADGDGVFKFIAGDGSIWVKTDYATNAVNATNADTVDGWHVQSDHGTYGLRPTGISTSDITAGSTPLSKGHVYIVYE